MSNTTAHLTTSVGNSDEKSEFLKYAISGIENRIAMIDQRSSILVAAHGIVFAVYGGILNTLFVEPYKGLPEAQSVFVLLYVGFALLAITVFMLLKAIRPSSFPLGFQIKPNRLDGVTTEFLWPGKGWNIKKERDKEKDREKKRNHYESAYAALNRYQIAEGLKNTNFVLLYHVKSKMNYYQIAVFLAKILVLFYLLSVVAMVVLSS